MAVSTTSIVGNTIGIANTNGIITTNTTAMNPYYNGYDVNRDTIYGIPSHDWHRIPQSEQRYWAERYDRQHRDRQLYEQERSYREAMLYEEKQKKIAVKAAPASDFMNNTLLLLEN